jgi:hypothetical protein
VTETIAVTLLAPVLAFYMLMDSTKFKQRSLELTPPQHREEVSYVRRPGGDRARLVRAGPAAGGADRGDSLQHRPLLPRPAFLAADRPHRRFLNLVPFVGPFVGGALAAIVALFNGSLSQALWAIGIFTAIQQFDNHVVTPLVQRARVNLSPLVIVLALIAGGSLAGLLGVVLAVPTVTAIRIVTGHLWRTRVLGESWQEASDAMIEITERPERMTVRRRRVEGDQQRLFDTAEQPW